MALTVTVMVGLALAAPSGPGFVGTFQAGCVVALSGVFGVSKEISVAYSIFAHAVQAIVGILVGLYSLYRQGLSFSGMLDALGSREVKLPRVS